MLDVRRCGVISYAEAHALQMDYLAKRVRDEISDTILSLSHEPVITLGRKFPGVRELESSGQQEWQGYPLFFVERGGEATFHGPGQIVLYPVIKLAKDCGPRDFIRVLEAAIIACLGKFEISGFTKEGATGVWVKPSSELTTDGNELINYDRKVASIGIAVRDGVTYHGIALNVFTDLKGFQVIQPCGFDSRVMVNLADLIPDRELLLAQVESVLVDELVSRL